MTDHQLKKRNEITQGVIWKQLLIFFYPILLGTFFQQLYNTADASIVGKGVGKAALAAVGGMKALKQGLDAVANAKFPGKTVIFPNCEDMPLTPVSDIASLADGLAETLDKDGLVTLETEKLLFEKYSK